MKWNEINEGKKEKNLEMFFFAVSLWMMMIIMTIIKKKKWRKYRSKKQTNKQTNEPKDYPTSKKKRLGEDVQEWLAFLFFLAIKMALEIIFSPLVIYLRKGEGEREIIHHHHYLSLFIVPLRLILFHWIIIIISSFLVHQRFSFHLCTFPFTNENDDDIW